MAPWRGKDTGEDDLIYLCDYEDSELGSNRRCPLAAAAVRAVAAAANRAAASGAGEALINADLGRWIVIVNGGCLLVPAGFGPPQPPRSVDRPPAPCLIASVAQLGIKPESPRSIRSWGDGRSFWRDGPSPPKWVAGGGHHVRAEWSYRRRAMEREG
ncbi:hypothetical protein ABZP36_009207 [Zizania latifolia]